METKAFQAHGVGKHQHATLTRSTALQAATDFFEKYPTARQCNVAEGEVDGHFFVRRFGRGAAELRSWRGVTKRTLSMLAEPAPVQEPAACECGGCAGACKC